MKPRTVFLFLAITALLRCVWLAMQGIAPQEAYHWVCGSRLAAAFFDGPPGTAFLVKCLGAVTGDSLQWIRFFWPLLGLAAGWLAWLLAKTLYDDTVAGWTVVFLNALPIFNEQCATVGPAIPLMVLILAGMLAAYSAVEGRGQDWWLAGALFALAILFRYEAVLVPLGFCGALLAVGIRRERPDFMALTAILLPIALALWAPLSWNASLNWIPIAGGTFQTWWRPEPGGWATQSREFLKANSVAGLILLPAIPALILSAVKNPGRVRFLAVASGPSILWGLYHFLLGRDFSTASWIVLVPLVVFLAAAGVHSRWLRFAGSSLVILALVSSAFQLHAVGATRAIWPLVATEIHLASREMPANEAGSGFLIAQNADQASILSLFFKSAGRSEYPPVFTPESPAITSQFGLWPSYADFKETEKSPDELFTEQKGINPFIGRNALFLGSELPQSIKGAFAEVKPLRNIKLPDGKVLTIHLCLDYQTLPL